VQDDDKEISLNEQVKYQVFEKTYYEKYNNSTDTEDLTETVTDISFILKKLKLKELNEMNVDYVIKLKNTCC